jgi:hypothetical protein
MILSLSEMQRTPARLSVLYIIVVEALESSSSKFVLLEHSLSKE